MFGLTASTVRMQCGSAPGRRFAWPGIPPGRKRTRGAEAEAGAYAAGLKRLHANTQNLALCVEEAVRSHGARHPVLGAPETATVLQLSVQRLIVGLEDLAGLQLPTEVRRLCDENGIARPPAG